MAVLAAALLEPLMPVAHSLTVGNLKIDEADVRGPLNDSAILDILLDYGKFDVALRFLQNRPVLQRGISLQDIRERQAAYKAMIKKFDLSNDVLPRVEEVSPDLDGDGNAELCVLFCPNPANKIADPGVFGLPLDMRVRCYRQGVNGLDLLGDALAAKGGCSPGHRMGVQEIPGGQILSAHIPSHRVDGSAFFVATSSGLSPVLLSDGKNQERMEPFKGYGGDFSFHDQGRTFVRQTPIWGTHSIAQGPEALEVRTYEWSGSEYVLKERHTTPAAK